jgi:hypothetical protein
MGVLFVVRVMVEGVCLGRASEIKTMGVLIVFVEAGYMSSLPVYSFVFVPLLKKLSNN